MAFEIGTTLTTVCIDFNDGGKSTIISLPEGCGGVDELQNVPGYEIS